MGITSTVKIMAKKEKVQKKIRVTDEDILQGIPKDSRQCPLALALSRATEKLCRVGFISASIGGQIVALPGAAQQFIADFDTHGVADLIKFDLEYLE
jgi:hypothetical protein